MTSFTHPKVDFIYGKYIEVKVPGFQFKNIPSIWGPVFVTHGPDGCPTMFIHTSSYNFNKVMAGPLARLLAYVLDEYDIPFIDLSTIFQISKDGYSLIGAKGMALISKGHGYKPIRIEEQYTDDPETRRIEFMAHLDAHILLENLNDPDW